MPMNTRPPLIPLLLVLAACQNQAPAPTPPPQPNPLPPQGKIEAAGGTLVQETPTVGTAFLLKIRLNDGSIPSKDLSVRVKGPAGWNADNLLIFSYPANTKYLWLAKPSLQAVTGTYALTTQIAGSTVTASFAIDARQTLNPIKGLVVQGSIYKTSYQLRTYWLAITGLKTFYGRIHDISTDTYTASTLKATATEYSSALQLDDRREYEVELVGLDADLSAADPPIPAQFNITMVVRPIPRGARIDRTFGLEGLASINLFAHTLAVQPDGKILAGGGTGTQLDEFAIYRLNPDGSIDASFGEGGRVLGVPKISGSKLEGRVQKIVLLDNSKLIVLSIGYNSAAANIARLNANGTLDTTFGSGGITTLPLWYASGLAVQPNGKIVVGGSYYPPSQSFKDFALAQLNADGTVDTAFDGDGIVTTDIEAGDDNLRAIALQDDQKILAVGNSGQVAALVRYNSDGTLDTSFDGDGKIRMVLSPAYSELTQVAVLPDGKILAAGLLSPQESYLNDYALIRLLPTGQLDSSFGASGIASVDSGNQYDSTRSMVILPDGKILLGGSTGFARFLPSGELDLPFGAPSISGSAYTPALVALADGRVLVGRSESSLGVGRLLP